MFALVGAHVFVASRRFKCVPKALETVVRVAMHEQWLGEREGVGCCVVLMF